MKLAFAAALLLFAAPAQAQFGTSTRIGDVTFHSFQTPAGYNWGTSTRIGNTTFHNFQYGGGTSTRIGTQTFHRFHSYAPIYQPPSYRYTPIYQPVVPAYRKYGQQPLYDFYRHRR